MNVLNTHLRISMRLQFFFAKKSDEWQKSLKDRSLLRERALATEKQQKRHLEFVI